VLVSQYVIHLQKSDPERFESFMILAQGNMLANGLLCPDLQQAPKSFKGTTLYLDTPILVQLFGLEEEAKKNSTTELINLLHNLGGKLAIFSHTRLEIERVIRGAADHIDSHNGYSAIVMGCRRRNITKSDLILLIGQIDNLLLENRVSIMRTPPYNSKYQINEGAFEKACEEEALNYCHSKAQLDDINSIRSIFVLREEHTPINIENCRAVLVTNNEALSRAAFEYGKKYEVACEVSSVITDYSLASIAWLKAPMGAPLLPTIEILSFAYAALRPSKEFLSKLLIEVEHLKASGKITPRDHQLLRSSHIVQSDLILLTLGDEFALNEETISKTLERVTKEIKKEELEELSKEQIAHNRTKESLYETKNANQILIGHLYWKCNKYANYCAFIISSILAIAIIVTIYYGQQIKPNNSVIGWLLMAFGGLFGALTLVSLIFGTTVQKIHQTIKTKIASYLIKKESQILGLNLLQ
jgi:hypothetical protein